MSNLVSFALASTFSLLSIWAFYFLIKKWSKFHTTFFGKALKVLCAFMLLIAVTVSLIAAYYSFDSYWEDDRVRVITEFQGVKLGWSKDEVLFRKGEPTTLVNSDESEMLLSNGDKELLQLDKDNEFLGYGETGVLLEKGKVVKVIFVCNDDRYEKVGGISCDNSVDRVTKQYGEPKILVISEDKLTRIYNYPKYNLAFYLSKSNVEALAIFDSTKVPNGFSFRTPPPTDKTSTNKPLENGESWVVETDEPASLSKKIDEPQGNYFDKFDADPANETDKYGRVEGFSTKNIDYDKLAAENDSINIEYDHCAPNLTKSERLRRLALRGTVRETRETGYQTYTVRSHEITFSANDVIICKK